MDSNSKHLLILRKRRAGKTLNMDMLKTFFQPDVDDNGDFNFQKPFSKRIFFEGGTKNLGDNT